MPALRFRKKPVVIEAIQLLESAAVVDEVLVFLDVPGQPFDSCGHGIDPADGRFKITTLEGVHVANIGDWIIKGVHGEFYPCKPDIFAQTYEPADERL